MVLRIGTRIGTRIYRFLSRVGYRTFHQLYHLWLYPTYGYVLHWLGHKRLIALYER